LGVAQVGLVYVLVNSKLITACNQNSMQIEVGVFRECTETAAGSRDCKWVRPQETFDVALIGF